MLRRCEMSSWYKVTFRQLQPINLGYNKHGVINETRIFITGQSMWGALSNAYFKKTNSYDKDLFENITCFYPMIDNKVLYPEFKDGEFYLGEISEKEFRKDFTSTLLSTAINPLSLNAKDESLHETDVILPKNNIKWVGHVQCKREDLEKIKEIYIGGDSRYGLGLMKLESKEIDDDYGDGYDVVKGKYTDKNNIETPLKNFLKFEQDIKFEGELKLLAEFDFYGKGSSPIITSSDFYINVGSNNITHNDNNSSSN